MEPGSKCSLGIGSRGCSQQNRPRREAEFKSFLRKPGEEQLERAGKGGMIYAEPTDRPRG